MSASQPSFVRRVWLELFLPCVLVGLLYYISQDSKNFFFPPLSVVFQKFQDLWLGPRWAKDVIPSLQRLVMGYGLACIAGIGVGLCIGLQPRLRRVCEPVLEFFRAIPPVALIPMLILVVGFGDLMKVTVVAMGSIWPILLNTLEGVKGVDPLLSDTCRVYQIKGWARLRHLVLPAASPQIVVGMRLGLSIAIVLMVISEMFAAMDGLGSAIIYFQRSFEIPQMWSGVLMLGLLGISLSWIFQIFERRVLGWWYGARAAERQP